MPADPHPSSSSNTPAAHPADDPQGSKLPQNPTETAKTPVKVWREGQPAPENRETVRNRRPGANGSGIVIGRYFRYALARQGRPTDWTAPERESPEARPVILEWGNDVSEAPQPWLWPGRIPLGRLTLLAGYDALAASAVAMDLAARLTAGAAWPGDPVPAAGPARQPVSKGLASVLYLAPHHEVASRCIPGLREAGADLSRLLCLSGICDFVAGPDNQGQAVQLPLELPSHIASLREAIRELPDVQLLVLDPLDAFFDRNGSARTAHKATLMLRDLAWDYGLAVVGVTRLKPNVAGRRGVPVIENKALAAVAGAAWGVLPTARSEQQHLLFSLQGELDGPGPALTFDLPLARQPGRIQWNSESFAMTAADFAEEKNAAIKFAMAASWLKGLLTERPHTKEEIDALANRFGVSPTMIWNLRKELRIEMQKSGYQGKSVWRLPQAPQGESPSEAPKFEEGGQSLEETAEISKLRGSDTPPKV